MQQQQEEEDQRFTRESTKVGFPKNYAAIHDSLESRDRKVKFVMYLFSDGPREYDFLLKILSLGRDGYWRSSVVEQSNLAQKSKVLDIACGTGLVTFDFASRKKATVVGVDVTREMLVRALEIEKSKFPWSEVHLVLARAESLPLRSDYFDCATISLATRNVSSVRATFSEMARCVKKSGRVMSMDFTSPKGIIFRPFYHFYIFQLLPALGLVISRHWNGIFAYLAGSIGRSKDPEQLAEIMAEAGLSQVSVKRMTHGVTALVSGVKSEGAEACPLELKS